MADNVGINTGTGATIASDEISGAQYQRIKLIHGADGVNAGDVSDANPLPIDDAGGSLTVDNAALSVVGGGTQATALRVTVASDSSGVLSVDDNGSSLTVDNAALSVVGGGVEATALRVTLASDSTGLVSVDDNGGSLTTDVDDIFGLTAAGQATSANSLPVVLASDQSAIAVTVGSTSNVNTYKKSGATVGATASTYTAGDVIGGLITFTSALGTSKLSRIKQVTIQVVESVSISSLVLFLFDDNPSASTFTDSSGFSLAAADDEMVVAKVAFASSDFESTGFTDTYATKTPDYLIEGVSSNLYAVLISGADSWISATANWMGIVLTVEEVS